MFGRIFPVVLALAFAAQTVSATTHKRRKSHHKAVTTAAAPKPAAATAPKAATTHRSIHRRSRSRARVVPAVYTSSSSGSRISTGTGTTGSRTVYAPSPLSKARIASGPWIAHTYADSTDGDDVDGEDLTIRRAAVDALGKYNGTVVAVDPGTGRILATVNQKIALESGFQPCSTIKVAVSLAALGEGIIDQHSALKLGRTKMNLTEALAHSNNLFFATLGVKLGYETFSRYAHNFGLGERAGLNIPGEQPGVFPSAPPANGGMGMLTSFGEGISLTPYELAALLGAIANGGTLYYLQYPRTLAEVEHFTPQVKRHLDIGRWLPDVKAGMQAAVQRGTARRASYNQPEPVLGKTGTCTSNRTHLGWFGSFNDDEQKIVVVVLLTGGAGVSGPAASQIAGNFYRNLSRERYFAKGPVFSPATLVPSQMCCVGQ
jgi:penicillin-binding protein 2